MTQDSQAGTPPKTPEPTPSAPAAASPRPAANEPAAADSAPETPLWSGRTHWTHFLGSVVLWVLGATLIVAACWALASRQTLSRDAAFRIAAGLLGASALVVVGRILWKTLSTRYRLTTQRLFIERGILSQTIDQTELVRLDDVRIRRTLLDRILGLGAVEVISTDITDKAVVLEGVRDPEMIAEHLRERMKQLRKKSLYVESL